MSSELRKAFMACCSFILAAEDVNRTKEGRRRLPIRVSQDKLARLSARYPVCHSCRRLIVAKARKGHTVPRYVSKHALTRQLRGTMGVPLVLWTDLLKISSGESSTAPARNLGERQLSLSASSGVTHIPVQPRRSPPWELKAAVIACTGRTLT